MGAEKKPGPRSKHTPVSAVPIAMQGLGSQGILPAEGVESLVRILSNKPSGQVVVSTTHLMTLMKEMRNVSRASFEHLSENTAPRALYPRPNVQTPYLEPRTELERKLADIWQSVLGIEKVGVHDNFFELGADSVLGIQVISKAKSRKIRLNPSQLFEYQTIAELAQVAESGTFHEEHDIVPGSVPPQERSSFTPSDFPLAGLSQKALDSLMNQIN
jgi:acyl carrier protein